jgi:hypothetical protein
VVKGEETWNVFQKKTRLSVIAHTSHARENTNAANVCIITGKAMNFRPVFSIRNLKRPMTAQ